MKNKVKGPKFRPFTVLYQFSIPDGNLVYAALMSSTLEVSSKELIHDGIGLGFSDKASGHYQHIGIVVLTNQMCYLRNPA